MKLCSIAIAMALAGFAGIAGAADQFGGTRQPVDAIDLLSQATGLTAAEVRLALGPSVNYEQPVRHASANWKFRRAVGRTLYEQIMGTGRLNPQQVLDLMAMAQARQAKFAAGK